MKFFFVTFVLLPSPDSGSFNKICTGMKPVTNSISFLQNLIDSQASMLQHLPQWKLE